MDDLSALIARHIDGAERPAGVRSDLLDRYMGEPYGNEVTGRSKVVTSEVFDVVEAITAEIMDIVASDQRIVSFTPQGPEDEDSSEAETDACNHVFWEQNNGFDVLQTWCKAGLIEQVGYCRSGWVESEQVTIEEYSELSLEDAQQIAAQYYTDPDITEVELIDSEGFTETEFGFEPELDDMGQPMPISYKVRCVKRRPEYLIEPIPQSSVLITPRWHSINIQDVPFFAIEHTEMTRSDLRAMEFHEDDIAKLSADYFNEEEDDRHYTQDNEDDGKEAADELTEAVRVYECWVLADQNEDGIAERLKVWMSTDGKTVMRYADGTEAIEEVDAIDVSAWTPIQVPHRHVGRSVAEIVDDLQAINTVLMRHTLDSIYATLYSRPHVDETFATRDTYADLASPEHGRPVRTKGAGAVTYPMAGQAGQVGATTLPVMEKLAGLKEERTGVTRLNQGMDADTLNKTMGGQQMLLSQGQKRLKLIIRNFAEGVRDLFIRMHRDLRRGNLRSISHKQRGQWVTADPITWPVRKAMTVSVGTGNGDRMEKQQTLMLVAQTQEKLMTAGSDMVDEAKLYETIDRMVKMGGYASASLFFKDPKSPEYQQMMQAKAQQPQQPDPMVIVAQAEATKAQAQAAKAQSEAQLKALEIELAALENDRAHERAMLDKRIRLAELQQKEEALVAKISNDNEKQDLAENKVALDEQFRRDELAVKTIL